MKTDKTDSTVLGILLIAVLVTWSFGFALINPVINSIDFLDRVNDNKTTLIIGACLEFIEILCIIGIVVTIYPKMVRFNERLALCYSLVRIIEMVTLLLIAICCISLIPLSNMYIKASHSEIAALEKFGELLIRMREKWMNLPGNVFYSSSAIVFNYFLYKARLVPVFIPIWGLISSLLVLLVSPLEVLGFEYLGFVSISMGLNEIFLGIWLLMKGFDEDSLDLLTKRKGQEN